MTILLWQLLHISNSNYLNCSSVISQGVSLMVEEWKAWNDAGHRHVPLWWNPSAFVWYWVQGHYQGDSGIQPPKQRILTETLPCTKSPSLYTTRIKYLPPLFWWWPRPQSDPGFLPQMLESLCQTETNMIEILAHNHFKTFSNWLVICFCLFSGVTKCN